MTMLKDVDLSTGQELIDNGEFLRGCIGGLPEGWTVIARNPVLAPKFELIGDQDAQQVLQARGNGREECFGWAQCVVKLKANTTYRLRVQFRQKGLEDINRHLFHTVHSIEYDGFVFNNGIFSYSRQGDQIIGEASFPGPAKDCDVAVRLGIRNSAAGTVWWEKVSLQTREPIPPRLVKIAVVQGSEKLDHWEKVLEEAGRAKCDIVLLPELFDLNYEPQKARDLQGPEVQLLSDQARKHKMYVSGALYLKHGELVHNSAPLYDREGKLVGIHNKNILYEPEVDNGATCGKEISVFQTDFGKVGIMTCYESWYPGVAQLLALKGAELILFPSAGYYEELIHARSSDNAVVIAASSLGCAYEVWDTGGNKASGEASPDRTRNAPTNIVAVEKKPEMKLMMVTIDLSKNPSPYSGTGPMTSAPGGRKVRNTMPTYIEDEISREIRRW